MLVAREYERQLLRDAYEDEYSQFVAVYGRLGVGKTFLVRDTFNNEFTFQHTGTENGNLSDQLHSFADSLRDAGLRGFDPPRHWLEAFSLLKDLVRQAPEGRKVIFLDELSWMDTPKSRLVTALESFWNGWASARKDILLIVCASATSWMLDEIVHSKGGLYHRLNRQIHLHPLALERVSNRKR